MNISSPTPKSAATPIPPPTVNAPVVELVEAVVAAILTTPPLEIDTAAGTEAEPIVPASLIIMSSTNVTIPVLAIEIAPALDVTPIVAASFNTKSSTRVTIPELAIVIAVAALVTPIVPPSLITKSSAKVKI